MMKARGKPDHECGDSCAFDLPEATVAATANESTIMSAPMAGHGAVVGKAAPHQEPRSSLR